MCAEILFENVAASKTSAVFLCNFILKIKNLLCDLFKPQWFKRYQQTRHNSPNSTFDSRHAADRVSKMCLTAMKAGRQTHLR